MTRDGNSLLPAEISSGRSLCRKGTEMMSAFRSLIGKSSRAVHLPACQVEGASDINIQRFLSLPIVKVFKTTSPTGTGIVHQNIESTVMQCLLDSSGQGVYAIHGADIANNSNSLAGDAFDRVQLINGLL